MHCSCMIRAPSPAPADQLRSLLAYVRSGNATGVFFASPTPRTVWSSAPGCVSERRRRSGAPERPHSGLMESDMHSLNARSPGCKPREPPGASSPRPAPLAHKSLGLRRTPPVSAAVSSDGSGVCVVDRRHHDATHDATVTPPTTPPVTPPMTPPMTPPGDATRDATRDATHDATRGIIHDATRDRRMLPPATTRCHARIGACRRRRRQGRLRTGRGCWAGRGRRWRRRAWCWRGPGRRAAPRWWLRRRGPGASRRPRDPRRPG